MITISFLSGPRAGEVISLPDGEWTVGRAPDNAVVIPDPSVSARHAELLVSYGEVIVRELGARNGTFVQGRRVEAQFPVESGQGVRFGAVEVRVLASAREESGGATSVTAAYALRRPEAPPATPPQPKPNTPTAVVTDPTDLMGNQPSDSPPSSCPLAVHEITPATKRGGVPNWAWVLGAAALLLTLWLALR